MRNCRKKQSPPSGFTLVELMVAVGLFTVVIGLSTAVFVSSLRRQRAVAELMTVYNGAGLALEQMMREARTGNSFSLNPKPPAPDCRDDLNNPTIEKLRFFNIYDDEVRYFLCSPADGDQGIARSPKVGLDDDGNRVVRPARLTGKNVFVDKFPMTLRGNENGDGLAPLVTISVCLRSKQLPELQNIPLCIQGSVTARDTDE